MNSIGIVRKIDELGRIVIPKEIRNVLNIKSNDDLEISVNDKVIMLKKFDSTSSFEELFNNLSDIINDSTDLKLIVTNKEKIVTKTENTNEILDSKLKELINNREKYISKIEETIIGINGYFLIIPIIINSDSIGLLIFNKKININDNDKLIAKIILKIIENKLNVC